jgi:hypothetical protein
LSDESSGYQKGLLRNCFFLKRRLRRNGKIRLGERSDVGSELSEPQDVRESMRRSAKAADKAAFILYLRMLDNDV